MDLSGKKMSEDYMVILTQKYKENRHATVCLKCCQIDCLKHRYDTIPILEYLIRHHVDLVRFLTLKFPRRHREELMSLGVYVVTEIITTRIHEIRNKKITPYLWSTIWRQMLRRVRRGAMVGKKVDKEPEFEIVPLPDNLTDSRNEVSVVDFKDMVDSCCYNKTQKFIMQKTMEGGYNVQDIADELSMSTGQVSKIRSSLGNDLRFKMKGYSVEESITKRLRVSCKCTCRYNLRQGRKQVGLEVHSRTETVVGSSGVTSEHDL